MKPKKTGRRNVRRDGKGSYHPRFTRDYPRFVRADPADEETMLYGVMTLVVRMGGQMWAESDGIDQGATFWLRFPTKRAEEMETPPEQLGSPAGGVD